MTRLPTPAPAEAPTGARRHLRRSLLAVLAVATASLSLLGCGPRWHVLSQASPDPFLNQRRFAVLPIAYVGLHVGNKTEAEYLSEKDPEQRTSFVGDKVGINEEYMRSLISQAADLGFQVVPATGPADAPFVIQPVISQLEPGYYAGIAGAPSRVQMVVRITTPDGRILDEIAMDHATGASLTAPASGTRLRHDGGGLGETTAKYLQTRVVPGS